MLALFLMLSTLAPAPQADTAQPSWLVKICDLKRVDLGSPAGATGSLVDSALLKIRELRDPFATDQGR